jgi:hypothetical protein
MSGLFRRVLSVSATTFAFTTAIFAAYILAFGLMRAVALPMLFQVPLVSRPFRPFLGHFLRGRWSLVYLWRNRQLVWHTFLLGFTTVEGWEFAESLFDDKVQEVRAALFEAGLCLKTYLIALGYCISHRGSHTDTYIWYHKRRSILRTFQLYGTSRTCRG